ncbi:MAG: hypothetical protein IPJ37_01075 [Bacteroidales bacterium]|nr:hypothetical protein [Bacteroidales bacterium]
MEKINKSHPRSLLTVVFLTVILFQVNGQATPMPDVLLKSSLKDQLDYLEERTKIYEFYRAIREDMFQKVKGNIKDTLSKANNTILILNNSVTALNHTIDSLSTHLESEKAALEEVTRTKNSISILGIEVNKTSYNSIMWLIVAGLAVILAFGFLVFKKNLYSIRQINKELAELKGEFEAYRKTSREAREKMSMDHFNELKRLKGG